MDVKSSPAIDNRAEKQIPLPPLLPEGKNHNAFL